jgi:ribosomal protein S18 acetylase RimI-like enzyme
VIRPATTADLPSLLALIADYQRFYAGSARDDDHNERFFARFLAPSDVGMLLVAGTGDELAGYACLYWTFSSVSATDVVLLNDLYVRPGLRGAGVGEALVAATVVVAGERGASHVRWFTMLDNRRAQRLYERLGAERSAWFEYEIAVQADSDFSAQ